MNRFKIVFILFFIFLISEPLLAYPGNSLIYPEKIEKISENFLYNFIIDFKIYYTYSIINKYDNIRANFIGSALNSFFDYYFINRKIKFDQKQKNQIISFYFDKLALYFQKQRTLNNNTNFNSEFLDKLDDTDFTLTKYENKDKNIDPSLIYFEIEYEFDFKNSKINLNCRKNYLFNNESFELNINFDYKYTSFYNDFYKIFVEKIMSFLLNQNYYNLTLNLGNSAFIKVDGIVVEHFMADSYPSDYDLILEEGEHILEVFEDGYDSYVQKIEIKKNEKLFISLEKKTPHCKLIITTFPNGAKIKIKNQFVGNSPLSLELPSGNHFILISQDGYESKEIFVSIDEEETEKKLYVYLMPISTTQFYIDYSNKILNQVYSYFFNGCYGLALAIAGTILYDYFIQFSNSSLYSYQTIGIYSSIAMISSGLLTFAIFEILSLTELWKYYQYINYYTL